MDFEKVLNEVAIPKLRKLVSDEGLREYLTEENSLLETTGNRLYYLAYFLKRAHEDSKFEQVVSAILNSNFKPPEARTKAEKTINQMRLLK